MPTAKEWTDNLEEMSADYYFDDPDSPGKDMAKWFGLKSPVPFFGNTTRSPSTLFVFQSEEKYYLWNTVQDAVYEIKKPSGKEEIKRQILTEGMKTLEMEKLFSK